MRQSPGRHGRPPGRQSSSGTERPSRPAARDAGASGHASKKPYARDAQRGGAPSRDGAAKRPYANDGAKRPPSGEAGKRPYAGDNAKRPYARDGKTGAERGPARPYARDSGASRPQARDGGRPARAEGGTPGGRDNGRPRTPSRDSARAPIVMNVRASAAIAISRVLRGRSLDDVLPPAARFKVAADAGMIRLLAYGVLRELTTLQWLASRLLDKPLGADDEVHTLILVGLQQLRSLGTAPHAAIHETVEAVEALKRPQAHGLVNAVLRRYTREGAALEAQLPADPAVRYAHPNWLVQQLQADWPQQWEALLAANNQQGPLTLRVNRRRLSRDEYLKRLAEMNIPAQALPYAPDAVLLDAPRAVEKIPGFATGQVSVQDASAQLAAELLDLRDGLRVLDACAAPGGKTAHLLECAELELTALDSDAQRLIRVDENLRRLKLSATLIAGDAGEPSGWWDRKPFDRILLDAPCSAIGVIRRHPDIKWLRRESDIATLQAQQLKLLKAAWTMLKPGGRLVFATCSTLAAEGDDVVNRFRLLGDHVELQRIDAAWGEATTYGRRIAPGGAHDGFYYAVLLKR